MALITSWAAAQAASEGLVMGGGIVSRTYRVDSGGGYYEVYFEETMTETRKWFAMTAAAVQEAIDENGQPRDPDATYSYTKGLENANIGSYTLERTFTRIRKTLVENGDLPTPEFSPMGEAKDGRQDMHTAPLEVEMTAVEGAQIWYWVLQWTGGADGYYVCGPLSGGTEGPITVSLSPTNTNPDPYYRLVRLMAFARKPVGEEWIISGTLVQDYRDDLVLDVPEFSPGNSTLDYGVPFNVVITSAGNTIWYRWRRSVGGGTDWSNTAWGGNVSPLTTSHTINYEPRIGRLEAYAARVVGSVEYRSGIAVGYYNTVT